MRRERNGVKRRTSRMRRGVLYHVHDVEFARWYRLVECGGSAVAPKKIDIQLGTEIEKRISTRSI